MTLEEHDAQELATLIGIEQSILAGLTLEPETATELHAFVRRDVGERATQGLIRMGVLRLLNQGRIGPGTKGVPALVKDAAPWQAPAAPQHRSRLSPLAARVAAMSA